MHFYSFGDIWAGFKIHIVIANLFIVSGVPHISPHMQNPTYFDEHALGPKAHHPPKMKACEDVKSQ